MYERIEASQGAFIGLHISGDISDAENRRITDLIEQRFQRFGPVRLLIIYEAPAGMISAESLYENLRFAKLASAQLMKMAVIGKSDWQNTWIGLFGLFGGIRTRYFSRSEHEAALAWLNA